MAMWLVYGFSRFYFCMDFALLWENPGLIKQNWPEDHWMDGRGQTALLSVHVYVTIRTSTTCSYKPI